MAKLMFGKKPNEGGMAKSRKSSGMKLKKGDGDKMSAPHKGSGHKK